jgi:NodT family efflux transporter outer membrane factor (OMF) lipoprotein
MGCGVLAAAATLAFSGGCTSFNDYIHQGFKVGPNYCPAPAPAAKAWIDQADVRVRRESDDLCRWWAVFNDPTLDRLMRMAYCQNLTLREAGYRVLQARAQLAIARGEIFPQQQFATGDYRRLQGAAGAFSQWNFGFNLGWELDFWGRYRRAITAAEDQLEASTFDYDALLVTLLGDVGVNYMQIRTDQERIRVLRQNIALERTVLNTVDVRVKIGKQGTSELDVEQARSNLEQTVAQLPLLIQDMRLANNRLCILLGIPVEDLTQPATPEHPYRIGTASIPRAPAEIVVGIPADLVRRRPDVRRAERLAAAQAEQIGIAEADFYPALTINGNLGWTASNLSRLFTPQSFNGSIGPSFQWNLLNYGRIINNVRLQDARFRELVLAYQQTALQADQEAENGLVTFLQAWDRAKLLDSSVAATRRARDIAIAQYNTGGGVAGVDYFNRYTVIEQTLIQATDQQAQAYGQIPAGVIQVYRALGGGWQIRLMPPQPGPGEGTAAPIAPLPPPEANGPVERIPLPPQGPFAPEAPPAPVPGPKP